MDEELIKSTTWFDEILPGNTTTDFFFQSVEYATTNHIQKTIYFNGQV